MNYELAKELKEAGFPQTGKEIYFRDDVSRASWESEYIATVPTLEELIEVFGENRTIKLQSYWDKNDLMWQADTAGNFRDWLPSDTSEVGTTPIEAVAHLWLALQASSPKTPHEI